MNQKEKIKVVWLCHFASKELADKVGVKSELEFASWISQLIEMFRHKTDVDLHIVSPNYYSNKNIQFKIDLITVHLCKYRRSFLSRKAENLSFFYSVSKKNIGAKIKEINPDLIHLYGSENAIYGAAILPFLKKIPVLISIQGFISLSSRPNNIISRFIRWNRIRYESIINKNTTYFTISTNDEINKIKKFNELAVIFNQPFPTTRPDLDLVIEEEKKYDLVYYAKISKDKGIEDFIKAIKILKKDRPTISAIIIGGGASRYIQSIKAKIKNNELSKNINFAGFQPTQQDVFRLAKKARVYVLPTYFDALPGSIRECMYLKIPVVAYAVGGIPSLNDEKECITLAERKNVKELVKKIEEVLDNDERTKQLVANAYNFITERYNTTKLYNNIIGIYREVLNNDR